ncbi:MAG: putative toxin-antitoxin system toxin component, PIN family [Oscillospiraceae bacterium]|jgi:putative PIN family toxin of toxin-antitoxin system|nr:putative toxin-antitoxin system toxin component, PIN family [Oscillospiraceae bacterium]
MMRRAVLDTNVLVSAILSPKGNAAVILGMISDGALTPVYCRQILSEYLTVLTRARFGFPKSRVDEALGLFDIFGVPVDPQGSDFPMTDESDRIFYDTAVAGGAKLITGNLKHFPEKPFIVSPVDFLLRL